MQAKQVDASSKNNKTNRNGKVKAVKENSDNDTEEDSDFEDPDEIEVPGGGKDLDTMLKVTSNPVKANIEPSPGKLSIRNRKIKICRVPQNSGKPS